MNSNIRAYAMVVLLATMGGAVLSASAADDVKAPPKPLDIPDVALKGMLLPIHKAKIEEHLQYYADMIRNAKSQTEIDKGRTGLVQTFNYSQHVPYQYTTAQLAVKVVTPLLRLQDPAKQINAALALSMMPRVTVQPALEAMIIHTNEAIRYLGWKGYQTAWIPIIRQGAGPAKKMLDSLEQRVEFEQASIVVGAIWEMLRFRGQVGSLPQGMENLNKIGMKIITRHYTQLVWAIYSGDTDMTEAGLKVLPTCMNYASIAAVAKDKPLATEALQVVIDMMWCSAKAYGDAEKTSPGDKLAIEANTLLLLECEEALNRFLDLGLLERRDYLRGPLTDSAKEFKDSRGDKLTYYVNVKTGRKYGVLVWVEDLKEKGFALKTPKAERLEPKPASQPATTTAPGE